VTSLELGEPISGQNVDLSQLRPLLLGRLLHLAVVPAAIGEALGDHLPRVLRGNGTQRLARDMEPACRNAESSGSLGGN
jgi:hypothetical protein